ncbi:hypothetical protein VTO73DRAFT_2153 [Trametes versicolor]
MTISDFRLKGLLSFALAAHHILHLTLPTITGIEMLLLCAYVLIWASKPHVRASTAAIARHLERYALATLPTKVVHRCNRLIDCSFYVLLWVIIWGPTSGLPMFLRSAWWSIGTVFTVCYVSVSLSGFLWVPALCYVGHPSYNMLQRAAKIGTMAFRWTGGKVRSLFKSFQSAAVFSYTYVQQHRPTLSDAKIWTITAMTPLRACLRRAAAVITIPDAGGRSTIAAILRATSTVVRIGGRVCSKILEVTARMHAATMDIVSRMHSTAVHVALQMYTKAATDCKAAASWASLQTTEACSTAHRLSHRLLRASVKTAAFFRKEPGTVECIITSTSQILEGLGMASDVLALVPFAVLGDEITLRSGPTLHVADAVKATVDIALVAPFQASSNDIEADGHCEAAAPEHIENEDTAQTVPDTAQPANKDTRPAQQPLDDDIDDDLDALIRSLATLVLSDPEEQPTTWSLGPCVSLRIPVSNSAQSSCFDLASPPRQAPTPFTYPVKGGIASAKVRATSSNDSFDTTLCGDSCASLGRFLDSKLHEQASGDPTLAMMDGNADKAWTPQKSCKTLKQTEQDLTREACRAEEVRVMVDTPAAKQVAWRALLTYGRRCEVNEDSRAEVVVSFRTSRFVIYTSAVGVGLSLVGPRAHIVLV